MTLLEQIIKERDKLVRDGRTPKILFLNAITFDRLAQQVGAEYNVDPKSVRKELFGMEIIVYKQYRNDQFRIYCASLEA